MTLRTAQFSISLLLNANPTPEIGQMTFNTDTIIDMAIEAEALTLARSAPDLLAALEGIIDLVPTDCQDESRAAIAKVHGE